MSTRLVVFIFMAVCLSLVPPGFVVAQERGTIIENERLRAQLLAINTELKSELDQVLLLQEAIKANARLRLGEQGRSPDLVTVDDAAIAQRRAIQRERELNDRLDAILVRCANLDAEKQGLLAKLR